MLTDILLELWMLQLEQDVDENIIFFSDTVRNGCDGAELIGQSARDVLWCKNGPHSTRKSDGF